MALKYGSASQVAAYCGYDTSDTALLAEVTLALGFIEEEIDAYCGTTFQAETGVSYVYNGNGTPVLSLGKYLRTLTSAYILDNTGARFLLLTDITAQPKPSRLGVYRWLELKKTYDSKTLYNQVFTLGLGNIEVTGDWGFTTIPNTIIAAEALCVKHWFNMRNLDALRAQEFSAGRNVVNIGMKDYHYLHPIAMKMLDKYTNSRALSE